MPRACVIVLDAVGAGELPDAGDYGDEGSNTLGNIARAVGGLDLPTMEALGLGNVEPLEGCPPQPGAPAVAGRLLERSRGKDTTTGHWELMGIVTPQAMPTYPHGFPDEVIDPFMNRTGRGVIGNVPASGTEIIQELGEEHQKTGKWIVYTSADSVFQIAAHEETVPLEELYEACGVAREILTGKHAVGRVIARPFVGEPGDYQRTPNRHDYSLEPRRPELPLAAARGRPEGLRRRRRSTTSSPARTSTSPRRRSRTSRGSSARSSCMHEIDEGLVFVNLVETDMLWGHRNDPENFHRCLQDFDRRLPDLLDALRDGDLLILTSDHGCDPTTPSTDHSREYAMLLAYAQGRNAGGPRARERRVRRRRRDRQRVARRQGAGARHPRQADRRALSDPAGRGHPAQARRPRAGRRRAGRAHPRLRARRRARLPDGRVRDGRLLPRADAARDLRADRRDDPQRRDARPRRRARAQGRRQALDRRRGGQDRRSRSGRSWPHAACPSGR